MKVTSSSAETASIVALEERKLASKPQVSCEQVMAASSSITVDGLGSGAGSPAFLLVFALAQRVFGPSTTPPGQLSEWCRRFDEMHGEIVVARNETNQTIGFVFVITKVPGERHVWLAGTDAAHRRRGVMSRLFDHVMTRSRGQSSPVTVNTYPQMFQAMPTFLTTKGFLLVNQVDTKQFYRWEPLSKSLDPRARRVILCSLD
jgi:GNAT superfamily N-acetyltransferase